MSTNNNQAPPVTAQLFELIWGNWASQLLRQVAEMGLADKFGSEPRSADELCAEYGMHQPTFRRFMRSLTGLGLVARDSEGRYQLTEMGAALKSGTPGAARSTIISLIGQLVSPAWANIDYSLRTGESALEKHYGMGLFELIQKTPGMAELSVLFCTCG